VLYPLLAILLAVVTAFGAGCGGSEGGQPTMAEFEAAVVQARDRVDFALARIPKAKSFEEYTNRMEEAAVVIEDAADDLEEVGAAENLEPETKMLISALNELSVDYDSTAEQLRETPEILAGSVGLSFDSWDKANRALAGMVGKGVDVTVLQRHT
jgi:hypothetical protein